MVRNGGTNISKNDLPTSWYHTRYSRKIPVHISFWSSQLYRGYLLVHTFIFRSTLCRMDGWMDALSVLKSVGSINFEPGKGKFCRQILHKSYTRSKSRQYRILFTSSTRMSMVYLFQIWSSWVLLRRTPFSSNLSGNTFVVFSRVYPDHNGTSIYGTRHRQDSTWHNSLGTDIFQNAQGSNSTPLFSVTEDHKGQVLSS